MIILFLHVLVLGLFGCGVGAGGLVVEHVLEYFSLEDFDEGADGGWALTYLLLHTDQSPQPKPHLLTYLLQLIQIILILRT
jgi:hypothetical protein